MLTMKRLLILVLAALLSFSVVACDDEADEAEVDEAAAEAPETEEYAEEEEQAAAAEDDEAEAEAELEMVEVAADGTEFDPPVEKEQIPDDAWICDMGTVHYAQMEEGDGTCPLCNMDLVAIGEAGDDGHAHGCENCEGECQCDHGHDHDDHAHHH